MGPRYILGLSGVLGLQLQALWLELPLDQGRWSQGVWHLTVGLGLLPGLGTLIQPGGAMAVSLDSARKQVESLCRGSGLGLRGGLWGLWEQQSSVGGGAEEARVGVPVHKSVDLRLRIIKRVCRWLLHLPVDALPYSGVQAHLFGREDRHIVLVDESCLLIYHVLVGFCLQLLTGQPEKHILLTVLCAQECPEHASARRAVHQLVKGLRPALHLLRAWWGTSFTAGEGLQLALTGRPPCSLPLLIPGSR